MKYLVYDKIDELLKQRGMSRRKLAMQAGISTSNMSALFSRRPVPMPDKYLNPIAAALGVDRAAFDADVLEQERTEKLQREYELEFNPKQVANTSRRIYSKEERAERAERARRFDHPSEQLLDIMKRIKELDDYDLDVIESWVVSEGMQRMFARTFPQLTLDVQKHDNEQDSEN